MEDGQLLDASGYAVSCKSEEALKWFNKGVYAFVTLRGDAMTAFYKALELDPDFLLIHCTLVSIMFCRKISCVGRGT